MNNEQNIIEGMSTERVYAKVIPSTRIYYVEPNYTTSYTTIGKNGKHSNEFENDLEDYSLFVNLSVEVRGRKINVTHSEDSQKFVINWESEQGKDRISFLQGTTVEGINETSNIITTDYTNTFYDDVQEKPSTELFGIESIDIEYNNMMVPQVTIKFVDVRGVALFAAEEMASINRDNGLNGYKNTDITGSFFKSFFTMPYPIFTLVVKGFYGQPVSYTLTVQDFRAAFQSSTGNFDVTVKFVGQQFSFLGDVMINALMAAPHSDWIGEEYWKAQVENGRFTFDDGSKMPTLTEFYGMIQKATTQASAATESSSAMAEQIQLDTNNNSLNDVINAYTEYSKAIKKALSGFGYETRSVTANNKKTTVSIQRKYIEETSGGLVRSFGVLVEGDKQIELKDILNPSDVSAIRSAAESLGMAINNYNSNNPNNKLSCDLLKSANDKGAQKTAVKGSSAPSVSTIVDNIANARNKSPEWGTFKFNSTGNSSNGSSIVGILNKGVEMVRGNVNTSSNSTTVDEIAVRDITYQNSSPIYTSTPSGRIIRWVDRKSEYWKKTLPNYPGLSSWIDENLKNLNDNKGYDVTNFKQAILFVDHGLVNLLANEKQETQVQLQENEVAIEAQYQEALFDSLGFVPSISNITKMVMAHFETLVHMIRETAISIESSPETRTMDALGLAVDNLPDVNQNNATIVPPFPKVTQRVEDNGSIVNEEAWVGDFNGDWLEKDLINGLCNGVKIANANIENASGETETEAEGPNTNTPMDIPLSPLDMIIKDNPYGSDIDFSDVSDVAGLIGMRMLQLFGITDFDLDEYIEPIAKAEAHNFRQRFGNPSTEFLEKLNDENTNFGNIFHTLLANTGNRAMNVETYGKNGKFAWSNPRSERVEGLVDTGFKLNTFNGRDNGMYYFPTSDISFSKINSDLNPTSTYYNKPNNTNKYLSTKCLDNSATNTETSDSLVFIDKYPQRYKTIIDEKVKSSDIDGLAGVNTFLAKKIDYTQYINTYKDYFNRNNFIYDIMSGTPEVKEDSYVFPTVCRTTDEADKTKAFGDGINLTRNEAYDIENEPNVCSSFWSELDPSKCSMHIVYGIGKKAQNVSLFGEQGYYNYSNDYHKAFLFLYALGGGLKNSIGVIKYKDIFKDLFKENQICSFLPYAAVLMAGALYWINDGNKIPTGGNYFDIETTLSNFNLTGGIRREIKNSLIKEFKNWTEKVFKPVIAAGLEINFANKNEFFADLAEMEDDKIDAARQKAVEGVEKFFINHISGDTFFKNYLTVDEDVVGPLNSSSSISNEYGVLLGMRDNTEAAKAVTNTAIRMCAIVTPTKYTLSSQNSPIQMDSSKAKVFLSAFVDELKKQYSDTTAGQALQTDGNSNVTGGIDRARTAETTDDIRVGVYRYIKLLYDKWIAGNAIEGKYDLDYFFGEKDGGPVFVFIDSFYHKIGKDFLINLGKVADQIESCRMNEQYTLLSFLSVICQDNKFNFFCINNFLDLASDPDTSDNAMKDMFTPVPFMEMKKPKSHPNFIIQYPYEPSCHLDLGDDAEYKDDSFLINGDNPENNTNFPLALSDDRSAGYTVPAFGVSYGKMYQSYFTDIDVNMDAPMTTEQAIKAQYQIASMNNENTDGTDRNMVTMGQDLYTIYSNNSYTCNVKMMGCAWVQPLMYFCLTNVPMFRGTYYIIKVTHHIQRGSMTTNFTGVRMANNCTRKVKDWCVMKNPSGTGGGIGSRIEELKHRAANYDNDCPYPIYSIYDNAVYGDGKIGSSSFPLGKGTKIQPNGNYTPYKTFGFAKYNTTTGLECAKMVIRRVVDFITNKKIDTLQRIIMAYHLGRFESTWEEAKAEVRRKGGISDIRTKEWYPAETWIGWQETYQKHAAEYTHMPLSAKASVSYGFLYPLVTFFSRQEQGLNSEEVVAMALKELGYAPVPVKNDNDPKKEDEFIKGFGRVVHETCANSAIAGNVGFNEKTLTKDTIQFTCVDNSKLCGAFDVCLNTEYFNYVQELKWVIADDNAAKSNPSYIQVKVSEKPSANKIIGVYKTNNTVYNSSEVHEAYIKSIVKYLKSGGNEKYITTPIPESVRSGVTITDCSSLIQPSLDALGYGGNYDGQYIPFNSDAQKVGNKRQRLVGEFGFTEAEANMLMSTGFNNHISSFKNSTNRLMATFNVAGTSIPITMHKKIAGAVQAAFKEIAETTNFKIYNLGEQGRSVRCVHGTTKASNHASGLALDINAGSGGNPWFATHISRSQPPFKNGDKAPWGVKRCPYGKVYDVSRCVWDWSHPVVRIMAKYGMGWGGAYGDTMHFSFLGGN